MGRWQETPAQNPAEKKMGVFTCDHDRKNIFRSVFKGRQV